MWRMPAVATIGVYGFTLDRFLDALRAADVRLLLDVRQRRGVRGSEYAWANATRLQAALAEAGIAYRHHKELAPTTELRQLQYREDDRLGVGKRSRAELAPAYRERYVSEILDRVDLAPIVSELPPRRSGRAVLCRARSRGLPPVADRRAAGGAVRPAGRCTSGPGQPARDSEHAAPEPRTASCRLSRPNTVRAAVEDLNLPERPDRALALRHCARHERVHGGRDRAVRAPRGVRGGGAGDRHGKRRVLDSGRSRCRCRWRGP